MRQKKIKLVRFRDQFATVRLDEVTSDHVEEWLDDDMADIVGSAETFNDYVRKVRELYSHYKKLVPNNPADEIELRKDNSTHIRVMPVGDVARLLLFARDHRTWLLPRLATELFSGVRFSTAGRLQQASFHRDRHGLEIAKAMIKTRKDEYIDSMPKNMWAWVSVGWDQADCWNMALHDYMHAKSALFEDAKIAHPHNGCRHTFASYHVAAFKNPGLTATVLCHTNQQMLWKTYKGKAAENDGLTYFKLLPSNVSRFALQLEAPSHLPSSARTSPPPSRELA